MKIIFLLISFLSSIIGSICGIGGGVIIKPVLDMVGAASVSTISFLSGCTVLSMSMYNVGRSLTDKKGSSIELGTATPLAIGAVIGGITGNQIFQMIKAAAGRDGIVGATQSICLLVLVIGTLVYSIKKSSIKPICVKNKAVCVIIGVFLGFFSSFLGIGGGPFNLVILHYFLGMDTKKAASNSLYIILFSQASNLIMLLLKGTVPEFEVAALVFMIIGGVGGGIVGRMITKRIDNSGVDKLFVGLLFVIILICIYNTARYLMMS